MVLEGKGQGVWSKGVRGREYSVGGERSRE